MSNILNEIAGKRLLVIAAHSDDESLFAGGMLLQAKPASLAIAIVTDTAFVNGVLPERDQTTLALSEQARIAARLDAMHSVRDRLGAAMYLLGCQNFRLPGFVQDETEAVTIRSRTWRQIDALCERDSPDIVLTHPARDVDHPQHYAVHEAVKDSWHGPLWHFGLPYSSAIVGTPGGNALELWRYPHANPAAYQQTKAQAQANMRDGWTVRLLCTSRYYFDGPGPLRIEPDEVARLRAATSAVPIDWKEKKALLSFYDGAGHPSGKWRPWEADLYEPYCAEAGEYFQKVR